MASAISYIQGFTNATITDAVLTGDVFGFTVPANSDFSLQDNFCQGLNGSFVDNLGLITTFANNTLRGSTGNNILGNCSFANNTLRDSTGNNILGNCSFRDEAFRGSTGENILGNCSFGNGCLIICSSNNTINNIILINSNDDFAGYDYTGIMNITGNIGTNETAEYPNFFSSSSSATINVKTAKQTSNAGGIEGDLATAIANGATVNFVL